MKEQQTPKKPMIFYWMIAGLSMLLLNIFVFPVLLQPQVREVTYDEFISQVEAGHVTQVAYENNMMLFTCKEEEQARPVIYKTGIWPWDEGLTERLLAHHVTFESVIPTQASPLMSFLVSFLLPMAFFFLMGRLLIRSINKKMGGANALQLGKANAKIYIEAQTGKTFQDVAGQDEAKEALTEIVDFLHDPEKFSRIGARLPKGALLVGPPGTGKTLLAKAVAGEAKVPFFSISGSEFVEMFVGMGAAKVRDLFKQAGEKAPCIVFIDEIDTIGKKRDNGGIGGGNDEREQTLNQLLSEMDGFDGKKGVVILAATNRPEILDPALLRPGRFDRRIPVELPDLQGRLSILRVHAKNVKMEENIDLSPMARATSGASGAELANIINEAALRAVRLGREEIIREDLEESVETVIAGHQRKGAVISDQEKKIIAYHEIGHALVAARQKGSAPVAKITIIPRTSGALGYTMQVEEDERVLMSRDDALRQITTLTGGRAAEELIFGSVTSGAANDIEKATKLARAMITRYGMSRHFDMMALETVSNQYLGGDAALACSPETAARIDREINDIIKSCHQQALEILGADEELLHTLARFLLEKETITGEEFMNILRSEA